MAPGTERVVEVRSPSVLRECGVVVRAMFHLIFWSSLLMTARWGRGADRPAPPPVTPETSRYVISFQELDADAQRVYRQELVGLDEAFSARGRTSAWPTVEALAAANVLPFAPDPIDRAGYRWSLRREGAVVAYTGAPSTPGRPVFAIIILEPDAGALPDQVKVEDLEHRQLPDGGMIHVSFWTGPTPLAAAVATPPNKDGWRRIVN